MVSDLESQITMLTIIVALLARLRCFEVITNDFAHFLYLCDQVISKKLTFTSFCPVEWSTTLPAIQNFEWGLARTCLKTVVVGEFDVWKTILPLHTEGDNASPEYIFKNLIDTLDLTPSLRMESSAEGDVGAHGLVKRIPKLGGKDAATV